MRQQSYRIADKTEETDCDYCGCPLYAGDLAYEVTDEGQHVYCSQNCASYGNHN